jgi:hypothetical protein
MRRSGISPAVLVFLLAAVSAGAGASVLVGSAPAVASTTAPSFFHAISPLLLVLIVIVLPVIVLAVIFFGQVSASGIPLFKPLLGTAVVVLLVGAGLVALLGHTAVVDNFLGGPGSIGGGFGSGHNPGGCTLGCVRNGTNGSGGHGGTNSSGGGPNGSGNSSGGGHNGSGNGSGGRNGTGNSSGGGSGGSGGSGGYTAARDSASWQLPSWAPLIAPGLLVIPIALLVVPALRNRTRRAPPDLTGTYALRAAAEMQVALREAAARLEREPHPREVVIGLYLRLLGEVSPQVGDVGPRTAGEIRDAHLVRLGVRKETADLLTRLFEEARYSSHVIDLDMTRRARDAIRLAEADLHSGGARAA